jgi:hypothetical protein
MYFETTKSHITFSEVEVEMVSKMVEINFILAGKISQQNQKLFISSNNSCRNMKYVHYGKTLHTTLLACITQPLLPLHAVAVRIN